MQEVSWHAYVRLHSGSRRRPDDSEFEALLDAGCDDAIFGVEEAMPIVEFDRESSTMAEAVASAVNDVESVGLRALHVLDQDLLTLADIADRVGMSREAICRYATGEQGGGGFPPPVNPAKGGTVFYRWSRVAPWLRERLNLDMLENDLDMLENDLR